VVSLARPGGNLTGVSNQGGTISAKRLELLKEVLPHLSRVAVLADPNDSGSALAWEETHVAAQTLQVRLLKLDTPSAGDLPSAFADALNWRADAMLLLPINMVQIFLSAGIVELAAKSKLPVIYPVTPFVEDGGLMAYAASRPEPLRRGAALVDRVLRGAHPGDLPFEQTATFDLFVNRRALAELGLTLPPHVASQVTEWVP
jgi:ABC-type uncharacterized transport system substrate-binding protein